MKSNNFLFQRRAAAVSLACLSFWVLPAASGATTLDLSRPLPGQVSGVPNFQKVNDVVYRGGQPTDLGFKGLAGLGIKTVIDLREIGEHSQAEEESIVTANGMRYVTVPMKGMSSPSNEQISTVLALFADPASGPVFVHCRRGADRTGTVIACYRISHDQWDNKKALSEARSYGMSWFERAMQSYVRGFHPASATLEASSPAVTAVQER
jgi:protein tyrosine/serine phosphatase